MGTNWDDRFAGPGHLFGTEAADFVARQAWRLAPGSLVLSIAEGEGRNAAHLARLGHFVTGFDGSQVALQKARALVAGVQPAPDFRHSRIEDWDWAPGAYDAVFGVFMQFAPPPLRAQMFSGIARTLRPGGLVLLHGFAVRQTGNSSGGPRQPDHLYTLDLLRAAFAGWQILHQADYDAALDEGPGHSGRAALIDFVARKP
jgi:SAM-dependent methyltransferase